MPQTWIYLHVINTIRFLLVTSFLVVAILILSAYFCPEPKNTKNEDSQSIKNSQGSQEQPEGG